MGKLYYSQSLKFLTISDTYKESIPEIIEYTTHYNFNGKWLFLIKKYPETFHHLVDSQIISLSDINIENMLINNIDVIGKKTLEYLVNFSYENKEVQLVNFKRELILISDDIEILESISNQIRGKYGESVLMSYFPYIKKYETFNLDKLIWIYKKLGHEITNENMIGIFSLVIRNGDDDRLLEIINRMSAEVSVDHLIKNLKDLLKQGQSKKFGLLYEKFRNGLTPENIEMLKGYIEELYKTGKYNFYYDMDLIY